MKFNKQVLLSAAVAGMLSAQQVLVAEDKGSDTMGRCIGANGCKGQTDCSGQGHDCHGKNKCKGQGWKKTVKSDCKENTGKPGKWEEIK